MPHRNRQTNEPIRGSIKMNKFSIKHQGCRFRCYLSTGQLAEYKKNHHYFRLVANELTSDVLTKPKSQVKGVVSLNRKFFFSFSTYRYSIFEQDIVVRIDLMHLETLIPMSIRKFHFISGFQRNISAKKSELKFDIGFDQLSVLTKQLHR